MEYFTLFFKPQLDNADVSIPKQKILSPTFCYLYQNNLYTEIKIGMSWGIAVQCCLVNKREQLHSPFFSLMILRVLARTFSLHLI